MDEIFAKIREILAWIESFIAQIIGLANGNTGSEE